MSSWPRGPVAPHDHRGDAGPGAASAGTPGTLHLALPRCEEGSRWLGKSGGDWKGGIHGRKSWGFGTMLWDNAFRCFWCSQKRGKWYAVRCWMGSICLNLLKFAGGHWFWLFLLPNIMVSCVHFGQVLARFISAWRANCSLYQKKHGTGWILLLYLRRAHMHLTLLESFSEVCAREKKILYMDLQIFSPRPYIICD